MFQRCLWGALPTYVTTLILTALATLGIVLVVAAPLQSCPAGQSCPPSTSQRLAVLGPAAASLIMFCCCCFRNTCGVRYDRYARYTTPYIEMVVRGTTQRVDGGQSLGLSESRRLSMETRALGAALFGV